MSSFDLKSLDDAISEISTDKSELRDLSKSIAINIFRYSDWKNLKDEFIFIINKLQNNIHSLSDSDKNDLQIWKINLEHKLKHFERYYRYSPQYIKKLFKLLYLSNNMKLLSMIGY